VRSNLQFIYLLQLLLRNPTDYSTEAFVDSEWFFVDSKTTCSNCINLATDANIVTTVAFVFQLMQILFCYRYSSLATAVKYYHLENHSLVIVLTIFQIEEYCRYYHLDRKLYLFIYNTNVAITELAGVLSRTRRPSQWWSLGLNYSPMTTVMV